MSKGSRSARLVAALALVSVALSGCSIRLPGTESLETAIPAALEASDLGITYAEASKEMSGASITVSVWSEFEADTLTADDLHTMLELAVDNANQTGLYKLEITALVGHYDPEVETDYIDLGTLAEELGFEPNTSSTVEPHEFSAPWDDVEEYLDE
jgi:hypothetical protein